MFGNETTRALQQRVRDFVDAHREDFETVGTYLQASQERLLLDLSGEYSGNVDKAIALEGRIQQWRHIRQGLNTVAEGGVLTVDAMQFFHNSGGNLLGMLKFIVQESAPQPLGLVRAPAQEEVTEAQQQGRNAMLALTNHWLEGDLRFAVNDFVRQHHGQIPPRCVEVLQLDRSQLSDHAHACPAITIEGMVAASKAGLNGTGQRNDR